MGFWHRTKVMLGLADDYDEDYEDYDRHGYDEDDDFDEGRPARGGSEPAPRYESPYGTESARSVHRVERDPDLPRARHAGSGFDRPGRDSLRDVSPAWGEQPQGREPQVKMHIVEPRSFGEAQMIADKLKGGVPVIMNLSSTDPDLSKRLIDFASGLTYGLDGGLQKVADRVFMLTPANVAVSAEDRRRLRDKGLFSLDA